MAKANVTVFMDEALLGRVRADAEADGRSISNFVEQLLKKHYPLPAAAFAPGSRQRQQIDIEDQIAAAKPQRKSPAKRK